MNYKSISKKSQKNSFDFNFLATIHMCQIYVRMIKDLRNGGMKYLSENRLKELITENVETLKCFVSCCK